MPHEISRQTARRLAVTRQQLAGTRHPATPEGILQVVREIGCLQLDPISAVARSHQTVMFSRVGNYDVTAIDDLIFKDRSLFEFWAHAASIVLTEDYPIHNHQMRQWGGGTGTWSGRIQEFMRENAALKDKMLAEIKNKGPMLSRQFEDEAKREWQSSGWTSGRNVSRMLDFLWMQGDIMVSGRQGLQKQWDLSERVLPEWTPREVLDDSELTYRSAQKSLRGLGVGNMQQIKMHYTQGRYPTLAASLKHLQSEGVIEPVKVEGFKDQWYIHSADVPMLKRIEAGEWEPRTTLLSPFDNLICNRTRTEALWDFYFRIEIYVPKEKRQYGYYVLPILHGDTLIGRIDPQMDRKTKTLNINAVYAEPSAPMDEPTGKAVAGAIQDLADFLGAKKIVYTKKVPDGWKKALK
jgi:uncharacterized protein